MSDKLSDLLSDITAASQTRQEANMAPEPESAAAPAAPQAPQLESFADLMQISEASWGAWLQATRPDDLLVLLTCSDEAFNARVIGALDDDSRQWVRDNLGLMRETTDRLREATVAEVLERSNALLAEGRIALGDAAPKATGVGIAQASVAAAGPSSAAAPAEPSVPAGSESAPSTAEAQARVEVRVSSSPRTMDTGFLVGPPPEQASTGAVASPGDAAPGLPADLAQVFQVLRGMAAEGGLASLHAAAKEMPDPLLAIGVQLLAEGHGHGDLELKLGEERRTQVRAFRDRLDQIIMGLLDLAKTIEDQG